MPTITTNDLKNGMTLQLDNGLFQVVEFQHVKPGKGGAFVRTTLKNARTGAVLDRTFRAGEKVEQAIIDKREMQFLYRDGRRLRLHGQRRPTTSCTSRPTRSATPPTTSSRAPTAVLQMYEDEIVGVDLPGRGRARRHRDRARRAGRPGVGCPQAGHARDRPGRAGAAVRRTRATRSRSTPAPAST